MGKLIVISAPSGAGKTSIVHQLLKDMPELAFSVSASSRESRENEVHGKKTVRSLSAVVDIEQRRDRADKQDEYRGRWYGYT